MTAVAAKPHLLERLDRAVPDQLFYFELVQNVYGVSTSIYFASLVAVAIIGLCYALTGDPAFLTFMAGFIVVGIWRSGAILLYRRVNHRPTDLAATKRWEFVFLLGAWAFAALIGGTGGYTLLFHPGSDIEILANCCVIGHIAGIAARNASRPVITVGQISLTCIPFMVGLVLRGDVVHIGLALFIGLILLSTLITCRRVFDNIVYRHFAYRKIETLAKRDSLTDLWNRVAFLELFEQRLQTAAKTDRIMALISIDLDRFKDINDTLGHPAGDAILREVADRLRGAVGPGDEIARIGGDEFLVMFSGFDRSEVDALASRLMATFEAPFIVNMTTNTCGASIGYALAPDDGTRLDELLRNADLALYAAKKRGRCQIVPYSLALSRLYDDRVALEHDLQFALANGELEIVYQPIVDPRSGRAICCEALLRWHHPTRGAVSPAVFIPIAESTGLIVPIGSWVLSSACREATNWGTDINVAVNLSPVQFRRGREIIDVVTDALAASGLQPRRLELEVTESVLIEDSATTLAILEELRAKNIGVSLDDFGTGFASLAYLNDFPFSKLKIDRKFSQNVDQSARTAAIIKGIAQTTRELSIELVAEGIETEAQLEHMRQFSINAIQGYFFSKPVSVQQLRQLISKPILPAFSLPKRRAVSFR
jgi:diguanylate cyclase (GGDEF)-like protein